MASLKLDVHPHPNIIKHFREKSDLLFSSASDLKASLINMPSLSGDAPDNLKKTLLGIFADSVPNIVRSCEELCCIPGFGNLEHLADKKQTLKSIIEKVGVWGEGMKQVFSAMSLMLSMIAFWAVVMIKLDSIYKPFSAAATAVQQLKDCLNHMLDWITKRCNEEMQVVDFFLINICQKVQKVEKIKEIMDSLMEVTMVGCVIININGRRHTNSIQDLEACIKETLAAIEDIIKLAGVN